LSLFGTRTARGGARFRSCFKKFVGPKQPWIENMTALGGDGGKGQRRKRQHGAKPAAKDYIKIVFYVQHALYSKEPV
jgi:hypothetical protein